MRSFIRFNSLLLPALAACFCGCQEVVVEPAPPPAPILRPPAEDIGQPGRAAFLGEFVPPAPEEVVERTVADGVTVARLANGLTVIVKPTRTAPVVSVRCYVRAGGLYEGEYLGCGLSHLLEHLVARDASHDMGPGGGEAQAQPADRVSEIGGQANAYTSLDHTCYHISAAAGKTDECIDLIADWMARPTITSEDFEREHGVVQRELEKGKDEPRRQAHYAHARNVFGAHPAGVPVIGYAKPLRQITLDDVLAYHGRTYVPQNMIFCVVGDVDAEKALQRACRAFAGFEQARAPDLSLPEVRPFSGVRRVNGQYKDLKENIESISFRSIPLLHEDLYALDVLAYVLATGQSSRLQQEVYRNRKLVTSLSCGSWTPAWGKGIFTIHFRADPDKADAAENAVLAELKKVAADGVTEVEVARAKRQKVADYVYSQQTAESVAATIATDYMTTGDVLFSKHYTDRIQAVTAKQIHAVAKKYITPDKMAITRLSPKLEAEATGEPAAAEKYQRRVLTLENGLRVILQPADAGLVSMAYVVKGGVLAEKPKTNGLGALMAASTTRGTKKYTAKQIDEFFDKAGGGISGKCGNNSFYWQATVLEDSFDEALEIFADIICRPTFPKKELDILRPSALAAIESQDEHWFTQLNKFFREKFFTGSPYGMLPIGREEVVRSATVDQLREHRRRHALARPGVLAVYGRFDPDKVSDRLKGLFRKSAERAEPGYEVPRRAISEDGELHVLKTDKQQAAIIVAVPGMRITNVKDRLAITVLDTIISGYRLPSGWLHTELRGKRLVYVVHAYNWAGLAPGAFITYAACRPEKAKEVLEIIETGLRRAASHKPTQEEIDEAVNIILTADLLGRQELSELAMESALNELYGLGHDFDRKQEELYRAVTPDDVLRVAKKYLSGGYVVTVATPKPELLK